VITEFNPSRSPVWGCLSHCVSRLCQQRRKRRAHRRKRNSRARCRLAICKPAP
jgi:hypothetical protein